MTQRLPVIIFALLMAVIPFIPGIPPFWIVLLDNIGLAALVAMGLVLLTGVGGLTSFGQAAFVGFGAYTTAVFAVGQQTGTPVLDMETFTKNWLMGLGPTNSVAYFAMDDNTHLIMQGAVAVAKLAVAGIRELGLPIAARALP